MPKVTYVEPGGLEKVVDGTAGETVMATAVRAGVRGIVGQCGGNLSCATCHVFVETPAPGDFGPVSEDEDDMLDCAATDRDDTSRLSCQLVLTDAADVRVRIPATQL